MKIFPASPARTAAGPEAPCGPGLDELKNEVLARLSRSPGSGVTLFLDYDGTVAPIRRAPSSAFISRSALQLVKRAVKTPGLSVCIVTGRSLENIMGLLYVEGLSYIGNHGLEVLYRGRSWSPPVRGTRAALRGTLESLKKETGGIRGVFIEDKGLTLSVHYRCAVAADIPRIRDAVSRLAAAGLRVREGKKVFELSPDIGWDKGSGILKWLSISRATDSIKIYLGDDLTDEDAFRALGEKGGITVKVGHGETVARYRVRGLRDVHSFIRFIISVAERSI